MKHRYRIQRGNTERWRKHREWGTREKARWRRGRAAIEGDGGNAMIFGEIPEFKPGFPPSIVVGNGHPPPTVAPEIETLCV